MNNRNAWEESSNWIGVWGHLFPGAGGMHRCYFEDGKKTHNDPIYGGHMKETDPQGQPTKDGNRVLIIPICDSHNNYNVTWPLTVTPMHGRIDVDVIVVRYRM